MSWILDAASIVDGQSTIGHTQMAAIQSDIRTDGGVRDGAGYGRANRAYLVMPPGELPGVIYAVTGASWAAGVATLTIGAHNIKANQRVGVSGITPAGFNTSTDTVVVTAVTSTTISFALANNPGAYSSGGSVLVSGVAAAAGMLAVDAIGNVREYDGSAWQIVGGGRRAASISASAAIANTASEAAFNKSYTIPANSLQPGHIVRIRASGIYSTTGTPTLTIRIRLGGTGTNGVLVMEASFATANNAAGFVWCASADVIVRSIGATGSLQQGYYDVYLFNAGHGSPDQAGPLTLDTTAGQNVYVGVQWGTANSANTVTMNSLIVEQIPVATTL